MENEKIEERLHLSMLYDFYGALLKEGKRRIFEENILEDYSLGEIAQMEGITRQGVHDSIKRASKQLIDYEEKLGLVEKFEKQKNEIKKLHELLKQQKERNPEGEWGEILSLVENIVEE